MWEFAVSHYSIIGTLLRANPCKKYSFNLCVAYKSGKVCEDRTFRMYFPCTSTFVAFLRFVHSRHSHTFKYLGQLFASDFSKPETNRLRAELIVLISLPHASQEKASDEA